MNGSTEHSSSVGLDWPMGKHTYRLVIEDLSKAEPIRQWAMVHRARFLHIQFGEIDQQQQVTVARDIAHRSREFYERLEKAFNGSLPRVGDRLPQGLWEHLGNRMLSDIDFIAPHVNRPTVDATEPCCVCAAAIVTGLPGDPEELYGFNVSVAPHCPCTVPSPPF